MAVTEKKKGFAAIGKNIREVRGELKKVIWPTRAQLVQNTATVLLACLLIGAVIWVFDAFFGWLFTVAFGG
ncbi:MAG TPA: preprotein translocase subunit SecE [Clostridiales bacterium]|nr:preprotein translocase subunit SecE [Clostridiales bacterium]